MLHTYYQVLTFYTLQFPRYNPAQILKVKVTGKVKGQIKVYKTT